ncbi:MAG: restriction endonuclease [candidate division Zixibacteria bacterium]|nr:restriction endonuclease [candidate division Zixibacteria bacterium]
MTENKQRQVRALIEAIPELTAGQLHWLDRVVKVFGAKHRFDAKDSDIFDAETIQNFGDAIRVHHSFSAEPFTKDKFEYVLVSVLNLGGQAAELAPKGNPGHDVTIDGVRVSLKTQADKGIKEDVIWISKFMELGKGKWGSRKGDFDGLRGQFMAHLEHYDRILSLRALAKAPNCKYELVEIPKPLLLRAKTGTIVVDRNSKQTPKPGYCHVEDKNGNLLFDLYFDAGTERKLQIRKLKKSYCRIHATWEFFIPQE